MDHQPIRLFVASASPIARVAIVDNLSRIPDLRPQAFGDLAGSAGKDAPDLILIHDSDRTANGRWLAEQIARASKSWPDAAVIVLGDAKEAVSTLSSGAVVRAYLPLRTGAERIAAVIGLVMEDLVVYPAHCLVSAAVAPPIEGENARRNDYPVGRRSAILASLTTRQTEVIALLAKGLSNHDIAHELMISESTVKVHMRALMRLAGAENRTQVVARVLGTDGAAVPRDDAPGGSIVADAAAPMPQEAGERSRGADRQALQSAHLSSRECEILDCLILGLTNKLISRRLSIGETTVKVHVKAILRKLDVRNRTQAAIHGLNAR